MSLCVRCSKTILAFNNPLGVYMSVGGWVGGGKGVGELIDWYFKAVGSKYIGLQVRDPSWAFCFIVQAKYDIV